MHTVQTLQQVSPSMLLLVCSNGASSSAETTPGLAKSRSNRAVPSDQDIRDVLRAVQLGPLLDRVSDGGGAGLDTNADWASMLSLGEQQRLAFARYTYAPCIDVMLMLVSMCCCLSQCRCCHASHSIPRHVVVTGLGLVMLQQVCMPLRHVG